MPAHRFWVPFTPLWMALTAVWLRPVLEWSFWPRAAAAAAALIVFAGVARQSLEMESRYRMWTEKSYQSHRAIADYIGARAQPGELIALLDIGLIGWRTRLPVIDLAGLVTSEIAKARGGFLHKEADAAWILSRKPAFMVLVREAPLDRAIAARPEFRENYRLVMELSGGEQHTLALYQAAA